MQMADRRRNYPVTQPCDGEFDKGNVFPDERLARELNDYQVGQLLMVQATVTPTSGT